MGASSSNRLAGFKPPVASNGCKVERIRRTLSDEELVTFDEMLASGDWRHTAISGVLREAIGQPVSAKVIGTHRLGQCSCR